MKAIKDSELQQAIIAELGESEIVNSMDIIESLANGVIRRLKGEDICPVIDCDEELRYFEHRCEGGGEVKPHGCPVHDDVCDGCKMLVAAGHCLTTGPKCAMLGGSEQSTKQE